MKKVVDGVGDIGEGRGGEEGVAGDAVAADGGRGDGGEVGGTDEGGVGRHLHQLAGAHEDGPELDQGVALALSPRHRRLHVHEHNLLHYLLPLLRLHHFPTLINASINIAVASLSTNPPTPNTPMEGGRSGCDTYFISCRGKKLRRDDDKKMEKVGCLLRTKVNG